MSDDLVKRIKDRGDWLVDAVATATQNRQFLRGEPECDAVACDAIRMNGEKAMEIVAKPLADRIEELEAKLAKAVETLKRYGGVMPIAFAPIQDGGYKARTTITELTGGDA